MIVGIDEAGRGTWAGPFIAAAVILDEPIYGLTDSKVLTSVKRKKLLLEIQHKALSIGVYWVSAEDIDAHGLTYAQETAMTEALRSVDGPLVTQVIVDGSINYIKTDNRVTPVVKADAMHACVSAASIVAKEFRDSYMSSLGAKYPEYGLEKHMGYGTAAHNRALKIHKPIAGVHRLSFKPLKKYV